MRDQILTFYADWLGFDPTSPDLSEDQQREVRDLNIPPGSPRADA